VVPSSTIDAQTCCVQPQRFQDERAPHQDIGAGNHRCGDFLLAAAAATAVIPPPAI
jgi:hypothetical protein